MAHPSSPQPHLHPPWGAVCDGCTYPYLVPFLREKRPDGLQVPFQIPIHVDIILQYDRDVVVPVGESAQDFVVRVPARDFVSLQARMDMGVSYTLCG